MGALAKGWRDGGLSCIALWELLGCYWARKAAVGLLDDVFGDLVEEEKRPNPSPPGLEQSGDTRAHIREDLMQILEDSDGSDLREWLRDYAADKDAWQRRAVALVNRVTEAA